MTAPEGKTGEGEVEPPQGHGEEAKQDVITQRILVNFYLSVFIFTGSSETL